MRRAPPRQRPRRSSSLRHEGREGRFYPRGPPGSRRGRRPGPVPSPPLDQESFRVRAGRHGYIEARIEPLQLNLGTYVISVGLLANQPYNVNFYELHQYVYKFGVARDGHPFNSLFYPQVHFEHRPGTQEEETTRSEAARSEE